MEQQTRTRTTYRIECHRVSNVADLAPIAGEIQQIGGTILSMRPVSDKINTGEIITSTEDAQAFESAFARADIAAHCFIVAKHEVPVVPTRPTAAGKQDRIRQMFLSGQSTSEIAKALGLTYQQVYQVVQRLKKKGEIAA